MTTVKKTASKRRQKIPKKTPRKPLSTNKEVANKRKLKKVVKYRVPRTRNGGTWTEAEFFARIKNALRNISRFWKVGATAKEKAKRAYIGPNKLQRVEFVCNRCKKGFPTNGVQIHHKIECGYLTSYADLPAVAERMFCEDIDQYEILCKKCHKLHHKKK